MSGKTARRLRKTKFLQKFSHKKVLAVCAGLCLSSASVSAGGDVLLSLYSNITKPFGESHGMQYGAGGGLKVTYRPLDVLNLFAQGDYLSMQIPGIDPVTVLNGGVGTGYHLELSDRISLDLNMNVGVYNAKATRQISGISAGGEIVFSYRITPGIAIEVGGSGKHYASNSKPLMPINAAISPGISFNIFKMFDNSVNVDVQTKELYPVFPVLYSWYENNSFGKVKVTNNEQYAITDVTVSFFQPQYMAHSKECAKINKIAKGETTEVDLIAFFNENMLELTEKTDTSCYVEVKYSCLGQKKTVIYPLDVPVYGRNNMSWDDDRRAAVFVSSRDPAAMYFSKYVTSIVRENLRIDVPINVQYAMGIFEAMNEFGLNYVIDPASAFEDNVGTSSIDFLQFPYQTLMYKGGDCDDLSILFCSLFETVGIDTAFITIPGHIFMAFDTGLTYEEGLENLKTLSNYIVVDNEIWIPLEITLTDEGFYKACRYGASEWNVANQQGKAAFYRMSDSWKIYQPISVPGATTNFNLPEDTRIAKLFEKSSKEWSAGEIKGIVMLKPAGYGNETGEVERVYKAETPLSNSSLVDILEFAGVDVALIPSSLKEEEKTPEEEFDEKAGKRTEPDPDPDFDFGFGNDAESDLDSEDKEKEEEIPFVLDEPLLTVDVPALEGIPGIVTVAQADTTAEESADETVADDTAGQQDSSIVEVALTEPAPQEEVRKENISAAKTTAIALSATAIAGLAAAGIILLSKKRKKDEEKV